MVALPQRVGASPSGKATDFDSVIRRFEPSRPSQSVQSLWVISVLYKRAGDFRRLAARVRLGARRRAIDAAQESAPSPHVSVASFRISVFPMDGLSFDALSLSEDVVTSAEVDIGRCQVFEALVIALVIIVLDEAPDLHLEITRQEVVLQQDAVLERLMPSLDFALGLRVVRGSANMCHLSVFKPLSQFARDVAGAIVRQQTRPLPSMGLITT